MKSTLLLVFSVGSALTVAKPIPDERVCNGVVIARLPPSLGPANPKFKFTPRGFFAGQWFQTYSSINDTQLQIGNSQLISVYDEQKDVTSDLTSYTVGTCPHIYTLFAKDKHVENSQEDDYPLVEPGTNITHYQDLLAYGKDTHCHRYFVVRGREPSTPGLVITAQTQSSPTKETVEEIKKAFENLGNKDVAKEAGLLKALPDDGSRSGLPDFICDEDCMLNRNSPPADGSCPRD